MTAVKVAAILGAVILALGVALLYFLWLPFRLAGRCAGVNPPRRGRLLTAALVESTLALVLSAIGLRRSGRTVGPAWHPCENCGAPIDRPSRAAYCSQACRRDANIRQRAALESEAVPF